MLKSALHKIGRAYIARLCRSEFESQSFRRINERPVEFSFVFRKLAEINPRTVLDVGTGKTSLPHLIRTCGFLVTATDNIVDYWPNGMINRHFHVMNDDITHTRLDQKYDVITCVSVLEHIDRHDAAIQSMLSLLNPGGHLLLTCPYHEQEHVDNVYDLEGSSYGQGAAYQTRAYCRQDLQRWFPAETCQIREQEFWQYWEGKHWTVGKQILPPTKSSVDQPHQHTCLDIEKIAPS